MKVSDIAERLKKYPPNADVTWFGTPDLWTVRPDDRVSLWQFGAGVLFFLMMATVIFGGIAVIAMAVAGWLRECGVIP